MSRAFLVFGLFCVTAVVLWPLVKRYPERRACTPLGGVAPGSASPRVPTELQRLATEISNAAPGQPIGADTLSHLRYVARFRLVVNHRVDPDNRINAEMIQQIAGPELAMIAGPWPPDKFGRAQAPLIPSQYLPGIINRLTAL